MATVSNFNFQYDMSPVILWQYQNAPTIKNLINYQENFLNTAVTEFWAKMNSNFLNLGTATTDGLSMWGQLLGVGRPSYINAEGAEVPFNDDQYRLLLQARIYLLTFNGSAKALNEFFKGFFPGLTVQIIDNYNMTVTIRIVGAMPAQYKILFRSPYMETFLPRPAGVKYNIIIDDHDYSQIFTFAGQGGAGFDTGTFYE